MGDGYNFQQLKAAILALSRATDWEVAKKEWRLVEISEADEPETCLCGHFPIIELCTISNATTAKSVDVGNVCVKRFLGFRSDLIFQSLKRVRADQDKAIGPDATAFDEIGFLHGMNAFIRRDGQQASAALHRTYSFDETCTFASIQAGHRQVGLIDTLNQDFGKVVFYLLYTPPELPYTVNYPLRQRVGVGEMHIGNRVVDADGVHRALAELGDGASPSFRSIQSACVGRDWPLETWAADLLLTCQVGQQFDERTTIVFATSWNGDQAPSARPLPPPSRCRRRADLCEAAISPSNSIRQIYSVAPVAKSPAGSGMSP